MSSKVQQTNAISFHQLLKELKANDPKIQDLYYDGHSGEWVLQCPDRDTELYSTFDEMYMDLQQISGYPLLRLLEEGSGLANKINEAEPHTREFEELMYNLNYWKSQVDEAVGERLPF